MSVTIEEKDISTDRIAELFEQAFFEVSRDDDGDIVIDAECGHVFVIVNANTKRITLMIQYKISENSSLEEKLKAVNKLNDEYVLCRFCIPEDDHSCLKADYMVTFTGGMFPLHLISQFKRFDAIVDKAKHEDYAVAAFE